MFSNLTGLKKQFNKANQFVTEKLGATEGTKLTEEYTEMEKKTDSMIELVDVLLNGTKEYLQPNPATRAKLMVTSRVVQAKTHAYPQPEGTLGESMVRCAQKMGESNQYCDSLSEMGEALKQMAEVKYALEDTVKQNFLEPLTHLQNKDVRDVQFHRKKLEGRRLDFDAKRRRATGTFATPQEIRAAEDKFEESYNSASMGMFNLIQNETEHISQLAALSEALFEYHSQCASILESLTQRLIEQKEAAAAKPPAQYQPRKLSEIAILSTPDELHPGGHKPINFNGATAFFNSLSSSTTKALKNASPAGSPCKPSTLHLETANNGSRSQSASPLPSPVRSPARTPAARGPCAQGLYDFDAENPGELAFKEGDIITLMTKIDDNWFQGSINGKTGMFPISYVQVLVPLP